MVKSIGGDQTVWSAPSRLSTKLSTQRSPKITKREALLRDHFGHMINCGS
jgi:hypothetical protein